MFTVQSLFPQTTIASPKANTDITTFRIQPSRMKQSQVGFGERSDSVTAWMNYIAYLLSSKCSHVYMTQNYDPRKPYVSKTNSCADILFLKKENKNESFEDASTSTRIQQENETFYPHLSNEHFHVCTSKALIALLNHVSELPVKSKETVVFVKIAEDGHYFCLLYFPFDNKRIELFDAGGSSLDIKLMKSIQYGIFKELFGIDYRTRRNKKKIEVISKYGYQNSVFDEHCQSCVYLYFYMRCCKNFTVKQWHLFMDSLKTPEEQTKNNKENSINPKEKTSLGFTGNELSNPNRYRFEMITIFHNWFTSIPIIKSQ